MRDACLHLLREDGGAALSESRPPELRRGIRLGFRLAADEILYGWGEQFGAFARTGGTVNLQAFNAPSFLQQHRSYSAIPMFLSSRGYGLLLLNGCATRWRIDARRRELRVDASGGAADYLVILGDTPKEILQTYTGLTGRPPLVPHWAFGLWGTGYPQEGQDRVLDLARQHRQHDIPLDVIILDYHWEEAFHNFRWRRSLFPNPDRLRSDLQGLGIRLGLILTPFVNLENLGLTKRVLNWRLRNLPPGEERADERALPEYEECRHAGLLSHPRVGWWFGRGGMLDFTNPNAARWWAEKLRPLLHQGIAFFKNDDGEYLPDSASSATGLPAAEHHNLYGFYYGRATYDACKATDDRRPIIYARSVWAGSQRYPAMFLGDQTPSFHHMRSTLRAGLNLGLAGFAYWTADVFGLDGRTTPETHMRYAQWAMFSPIARYFWRPPSIDPTRFPWSHGPQAEDNFRRLARLRRSLLPYYNCLAWEAHLTGVPLLRPMLLEFPGDKRFAATEDQVMIGDRLLLAPVLRAGARGRTVILPDGTWHDFWAGQSWPGGVTVTVPAPIDRVPLLVRGGAILPMLPPSAPAPGTLSFEDLELHLWSPFSGTLVLREDDGLTRAYLRGEAAVTRIEVEQSDAQVDLRVSPTKGTFPGLPQQRRWTVVLHGAAVRELPWPQPEALASHTDNLPSEARIAITFPTEEGCRLQIPGVEATLNGGPPDARHPH
jgi:alpha-glucosidase (family GH31 glycosyl hydrolase)